MVGPRKKVDILSNQLPNDSGNDSVEKKKRCKKSCSNRVIQLDSQKLMTAFWKAVTMNITAGMAKA